MAGLFLPKLASKIKPSTAINRNWENVTMFPHPGNCLQAWRRQTSIRAMPWRTNTALGSNKKRLTAHNPRASINLAGLYRFIRPGSHVAFVKHFPARIYSPILVDTRAAIPSSNISKEEASSHLHHGAHGELGQEVKEEIGRISQVSITSRQDLIEQHQAPT